jgi:hypothetical protein
VRWERRPGVEDASQVGVGRQGGRKSVFRKCRTPQDLLATVYRHLGIDCRQEFKNFAGRPIAILNEGEPIRELVG